MWITWPAARDHSSFQSRSVDVGTETLWKQAHRRRIYVTAGVELDSNWMRSHVILSCSMSKELCTTGAINHHKLIIVRANTCRFITICRFDLRPSPPGTNSDTVLKQHFSKLELVSMFIIDSWLVVIKSPTGAATCFNLKACRGRCEVFHWCHPELGKVYTFKCRCFLKHLHPEPVVATIQNPSVYHYFQFWENSNSFFIVFLSMCKKLALFLL